MFKTAELNKRRREERKKGNTFANKQRMNALKTELLDKLKLLETVDSMEIEIAENIAGMFLNVITKEITDYYEFQQIDSTHFVFTNKVLDI